jgi:hypothetical protein
MSAQRRVDAVIFDYGGVLTGPDRPPPGRPSPS